MASVIDDSRQTLPTTWNGLHSFRVVGNLTNKIQLRGTSCDSPHNVSRETSFRSGCEMGKLVGMVAYTSRVVGTGAGGPDGQLFICALVLTRASQIDVSNQISPHFHLVPWKGKGETPCARGAGSIFVRLLNGSNGNFFNFLSGLPTDPFQLRGTPRTVGKLFIYCRQHSDHLRTRSTGV